MRIDWARLGILLRDGGRGGEGVGFISGGTGGSLKIQVGNVKYIYIIKYSLNFEMVEWAPPSLQECTGVRCCGGPPSPIYQKVLLKALKMNDNNTI